MLTDTATWTHLGAFLGRGGKVIYTRGMSDPWLSVRDTLDYFKCVEAANGEQARAKASRVYLVPGMGHCGGGTARDQADLPTPLEGWLEQGRAGDAGRRTHCSGPAIHQIRRGRSPRMDGPLSGVHPWLPGW